MQVFGSEVRPADLSSIFSVLTCTLGAVKWEDHRTWVWSHRAGCITEQLTTEVLLKFLGQHSEVFLGTWRLGRAAGLAQIKVRGPGQGAGWAGLCLAPAPAL